MVCGERSEVFRVLSMAGIEQMVLDHSETCGSYGCECVGWFPWISVRV